MITFQCRPDGSKQLKLIIVFIHLQYKHNKTIEPMHDEIIRIVCLPSEDLDQPRHPLSSIIVFTVDIRNRKPIVSN